MLTHLSSDMVLGIAWMLVIFGAQAFVMVMTRKDRKEQMRLRSFRIFMAMTALAIAVLVVNAFI